MKLGICRISQFMILIINNMQMIIKKTTIKMLFLELQTLYF